MANLNTIEKQHKQIFNNLSMEEKRAYYKKLSEAKYKNMPFFTAEGTLIGDLDKYNTIDKMVVEINEVPNLEELIFNASLSVISDYGTLKEKYNEELLVAFNLYYKSLNYNLEIVDNVIYFLDSFLGVFTEEPSELLFYVLQDVAKATIKTYNEAIVIVNSVINNVAVLDEEDNIEEIAIFKEQIKEKESKYNAILNEILNLEKPEGVK